jgi:putative spermidine/putrescine transport system permease protein
VQPELSEPDARTEGAAPARSPTAAEPGVPGLTRPLTARRADRRRFEWRGYVLLSPGLLVTSFVFFVAMAILLSYSFREFTEGRIQPGYSTETWSGFLTSSFDWSIVATTLKLGAVTVVAAALVGYPMALALYRLRSRTLRYLAYFLIFSPLLTSVVVRSYGWALVLGDGGVINNLLLRFGLVDRPVRILYEFSGVTVGLVHILLPFMIFPILSTLQQLDPMLEESAADLGAPGWTTFRRVVFPLTVQGVIAGSQLVFALAISAFATPALLGGGRVQVLAGQIYSDVGGLNWPSAAVGSYVLLVLALVAIALFSMLLRAQTGTRRATWEYAR